MNAVCCGEALQAPTDADLRLLTLLSEHTDPNIRLNALRGIARLGQVSQRRDAAIKLGIGTDIGAGIELAEGLAMVFHPSSVDPACLTQNQLRSGLWKLVPVGDLDAGHRTYYLPAFVDWASRANPQLTFEFILARLDYEASLEAYSAEPQVYRSVPYAELQPLFRGFRRTAAYSTLLSEVRDRLVNSKHSQYRLAHLFWSMGDLDIETLSVVDEWLHSGDRHKVAGVLQLIGQGPKNLALTLPYFALHVIDSATSIRPDLGEEATRILVAHVTDGGVGKAGDPPAEMLALREKAVMMAEQVKNIPPGMQLFSQIACSIDQRIRSWRDMFEESRTRK